MADRAVPPRTFLHPRRGHRTITAMRGPRWWPLSRRSREEPCRSSPRTRRGQADTPWHGPRRRRPHLRRGPGKRTRRCSVRRGCRPSKVRRPSSRRNHHNPGTNIWRRSSWGPPHDASFPPMNTWPATRRGLSGHSTYGKPRPCKGLHAGPP